MFDVVSLLLVGVLVVFVGWPLFGAPAAGVENESEGRSPLERQKLEAYAAIKEAEFDRRMGKLSEEDFVQQTERYRRQALAAIAALDKPRRPLRKDLPRGAGRSPARIAFCPSCGERVPPAANYCGGCGRSLREAVA